MGDLGDQLQLSRVPGIRASNMVASLKLEAVWEEDYKAGIAYMCWHCLSNRKSKNDASG